jgi:hypothetical protein
MGQNFVFVLWVMGMDLVECFVICGCRCGCGLEGCVVASGGWIVVGGKRWITVGKTIVWLVEKAGLRGGFLVDYGRGLICGESG